MHDMRGPLRRRESGRTLAVLQNLDALKTGYHTMKCFLFCIISLLLSGFAVARAQTGTITGTVMDRVSNEPLPSANVLVVGTSLGASTDPDGNFTIRDVPVGTYQIRATLVGYEPIILADVVVASGRPTDVHIKMDQETIGLGEVEVTASYFRRTPEAAVSVQRLSYEEIRRSPGGFEDVVRAVAVFPGVAQVSAGRNDLIVRGGAPSENIYVVDNIEIPNINHFSTQGSGGGPLSYINLDFVRETSFSTGGFGVRYGDRLSSVLTIDLREGRTDRLGGKATDLRDAIRTQSRGAGRRERNVSRVRPAELPRSDLPRLRFQFRS